MDICLWSSLRAFQQMTLRMQELLLCDAICVELDVGVPCSVSTPCRERMFVSQDKQISTVCGVRPADSQKKKKKKILCHLGRPRPLQPHSRSALTFSDQVLRLCRTIGSVAELIRCCNCQNHCRAIFTPNVLLFFSKKTFWAGKLC